MIAYTKGPWRWVGVPGESYLITGDIPDDGCESDVSVMGYAPYEGLWFSCCIGKKGEDIANAVLIAAAPELLEALERLARDEWLDDGDPRLDEARAMARAAIAKAKE